MQEGAVPVHDPMGLLLSPSHILGTSPPLRPNPVLQVYVATVPKSRSVVELVVYITCPLRGGVKEGQVIAGDFRTRYDTFL